MVRLMCERPPLENIIQVPGKIDGWDKQWVSYYGVIDQRLAESGREAGEGVALDPTHPCTVQTPCTTLDAGYPVHFDALDLGVCGNSMVVGLLCCIIFPPLFVDHYQL